MADKILVLEKGVQKFYGPYSELIEREDGSHLIGDI